MVLLAFDTAGPDCAVALAEGDASEAEIRVHSTERIGRGHAERLMPMIEAALDQAGLGFEHLDRIAVTTGPGSFTGVRVGVAAARALSLALGIPAVGIGSLDALAAEVMRGERHGTAVAVLDAKRGELYALAVGIGSGAPLLGPMAAAVDSVAGRLAKASAPLVLTGSGAPLLAAALPGAELRLAGTAEVPDIATVAALGLRADPNGRPVPLYLRSADAKPQGDKAVGRA